MDSAISKEELTEALKHLQIVEQLPRTTVEEFCRVFKIAEGISDFRALLAVLKTKIVDIFLQEREAYEDYLQLPKFRAMGPELCQQLISLFKSIWTECHNRHLQFRLNSVSRELEQIAPVFQNETQAQKFHRSLLQLYKDSDLCQRNKPLSKKIQEHQKNQQENVVNLPESNLLQSRQKLSNQLASGIVPYLPSPNPQPKLEAQQGVGYLFDNKEPQKLQPPTATTQSHPIFEVPRFQVQPPFLVPSSQLDFYQNQLKMAYSGKNEGTFLYRPPPTSIVRNIFSQQLVEHTIKRFKSYQYVQCSCQGKKTSDISASFKCQSCRFSYHYSCMMMQGEASEAVTCPLCILRKETLFCTVVKEPLKCVWHLQEKHKFEFRLQMTQEDSSQIYDARRHGLDCQVRFLKIDGKLFKRDKKNQPQIFQQDVKHSQITLPELSQDKNNPISLEVLLRPDNQADQSRRLYFFAVFLVRMKKIEEILMEVFDSDNYFGQSYYDQFMDQSEKIVVPLKQTSQRDSLIKYPVRGALCKHAEVFDFKKFLEKVNDLKREKEKQLACEICGQPCSSFKYDSLINRCINGFSDYEDRQPEAIQICRNGEIQWVSLNIADSQEKKIGENGSKEGEHQQIFMQEEDSDQQGSQ